MSRILQLNVIKTLIPKLGQTIKVQFRPDGSFIEVTLNGVDIESNLIKVNTQWITPLWLDGSSKIK